MDDNYYDKNNHDGHDEVDDDNNDNEDGENNANGDGEEEEVLAQLFHELTIFWRLSNASMETHCYSYMFREYLRLLS